MIERSGERKRRGTLVWVGIFGAAVAGVALGVAACSGDGDAAGDDDDAIPDAGPDGAPPALDGGDDAGAPAPFVIFEECAPGDGGVGSDAGTDGGAADGGVADGGAPSDVGRACCPGECGAGTVCLEDRNAGTKTCTADCTVGDNGPCGGVGVCASFGGRGACIPAAALDQPCSPEPCAEGLQCVGSSADDAVCKTDCTADPSVCAGGQTCTVLSNGKSACL